MFNKLKEKMFGKKEEEKVEPQKVKKEKKMAVILEDESEEIFPVETPEL